MLRITAIAIAVASLNPAQSWAQPSVTHFTVKETATFLTPPARVLESGPVLHLFGQHNLNPLTDFVGSEEDKMKVVGPDGMGIHDAHFDAHLVFSPEGIPLHGALHIIESRILPGQDGVDGYWEGTGGAGRFSDGNFLARLAFRGVGALEGQQLFLTSFNDQWDGEIHVPSPHSIAAVPEPSATTLAAFVVVGATGLFCIQRERLPFIG